MKISIKQALTAIVASLAILVGVASQSNAQSVIEDIQRRGKLVVGFSSFVPWAMLNRDGEYIGFEVDVATRLAKDMGVEIELVPTAWDGIIPALLAKKFDVIISGMSNTPKRNLSVNFTDSYAFSRIGMVANKSEVERLNLKTKEDWNSRKVTLTTRRAATPNQTVDREFPKAKRRRFDDDAQGLQEVINGNATAFLSSEPKATYAAIDNPETLVTPFGFGPFDRSGAAFAVRKGDADALNYFNNWISYHTLDGWLPTTHGKWFATRDWEAQTK